MTLLPIYVIITARPTIGAGGAGSPEERGVTELSL